MSTAVSFLGLAVFVYAEEIEATPTRIVIAEQDEELAKVIEGIVCNVESSGEECVEVSSHVQVR